MATFFGEILPVTSRAVDEDDDDDDVALPSECSLTIQWADNMSSQIQCSAGQKLRCDVLIVAYGTEANAFTQIFVAPTGYVLVGRVLTNGLDTGLEPTVPGSDKTCHIFQNRAQPSIFLCQCKVDVPPEHSYAWAKLLTDTWELTRAETIILTSSGMSSYCSHQPFSDLEPPFLRYLATTSFTDCFKCKLLEQPNMVTGLPAQLMTFCQVLGYKAVLYVCFKEKRYVDTADIKTFLPVLQTSPLKDIIEENKMAEQMLKDFIKMHTLHDMMYM